MTTEGGEERSMGSKEEEIITEKIADGTITTHDYSNTRENIVERINIVYSSTNYTNSSATHALFNIIHITNAKPAVVTIDRNHTFTNGEEVLLQNIQGMSLLSGINYIVANKTDTTFELKDSDTRYMNNFLYYPS